MTTPYRTSSELATTAPAPTLPPARYRPIPVRTWRAIGLGLPLALYAAFIAATLNGYLLGTNALGALLVVLCTLVVVQLRRRRRAIAMLRRNDDAVALLNAGRVAEAARALDELIAQSRTLPVWNAIFVQSRAAVFVQQGELARARELLDAAEASGWIQTGVVKSYYGHLLANRARAAALAGELDAAEAALARARAELSDARRPMLLPVEAVVALRRGHAQDAAARIDAQYLDAEGVLPAHAMRVLRVLRAFALGQAPAPDPEALRETLAGARPFRPGEFDYLAVAWPALGGFLVAHGFVTADAAALPAVTTTAPTGPSPAA